VIVGVCLAMALFAGDSSGAEERSPQPSSTRGETATKTVTDQDLREAAWRAVQLIDRTSANFLTTRECFTCHTQTLSAMVLNDAARLGFAIDEANLKRQSERALEVHRALGGVRVDTVGYALWALDIGQHPPDDKTEAMADYLLNYQKEVGTWRITVNRPPAEASNFTTNYVALRGVNRYGSAQQRDPIATRVAALKQWLESATVADTEDEVFRLRLAHELKVPAEMRDRFAQKLLGGQHADGGWAQRPGMNPDPYATGSVLVAVHEAAGISRQSAAWRRGLGYLLRTQRSDGSWHVTSRAVPLQPYFESGFPHGKDQFISAFATGWATEALLLSLRMAEDTKNDANNCQGRDESAFQ
jgi:N-acyl-D-amino-acid deacylase